MCSTCAPSKGLCSQELYSLHSSASTLYTCTAHSSEATGLPYRPLVLDRYSSSRGGSAYSRPNPVLSVLVGAARAARRELPAWRYTRGPLWPFYSPGEGSQADGHLRDRMHARPRRAQPRPRGAPRALSRRSPQGCTPSCARLLLQLPTQYYVYPGPTRGDLRVVAGLLLGRACGCMVRRRPPRDHHAPL